eukprot:scaffold133375_cov91-Phaeocystis_antarctica.AAC.1
MAPRAPPPECLPPPSAPPGQLRKRAPWASGTCRHRRQGHGRRPSPSRSITRPRTVPRSTNVVPPPRRRSRTPPPGWESSWPPALL